MSIKGIDNQIMVARTAEVSQNSNLQNARRGELNQAQVAVQGQLEEAQETHTVVRTESAEQTEIRDGGGGQNGPGGQPNPRRKQDAPDDGDLPAGFGEARRIDIKI